MKMIEDLAKTLRKRFGKQEETYSRIVHVPADMMEELCSLWDDHDENETRMTKYKLWAYLVREFPEISHGDWRLVFTGALTAEIRKIVRT